MNKHIRLSVIVPVYNVEPYLARCIDSILKIDAIPIEIILVNDGSTDNSGSICDEYARMDNRIQVIHQQNKGLGPSRNLGLTRAVGDYIVFVDSDDWIDANKLIALCWCAENHNAEMVLGDFQYCFDNERTSKSYINLQDYVCDVVLYGDSILESYKQGCPFVSMACLYIFSRNFITENKLQFDNIIHEDELWTTKALCFADRVVFTRICFYNYFQRDDSIMASTPSVRRVSSLFYIAYALLLFCQHQIKNCEKGNKAFIEFILLRISELYKTAFKLLSKIKDSSIVVPTHHLRSLYYNMIFLRGNTRQRYLNNYRASISFLREYNKWKRSVWVREINKKKKIEDKLILVYNLMWDCPLDIPLERIPAGYQFTTDRKCFHDADMVVFHLPTLRENIDVDLEKPESQKWVGWSLECEENYSFMKDDEFMSVFDYKMTYHQNADVVFPYYEASYESVFVQSLGNERTKDVCMLISSPFNKSNRKEYLKELMSYISIDSYGRLYNNAIMAEDLGRESKLKLYEQYKFVIAFENSCAPDYVTEKFYDPLLSGAVPIYLGADNIDEFIPGDNCYIDVREYPNPRYLAEYLKVCINNNELYNKHQRWRKEPIKQQFTELLIEQRVNPFIRLCSLI